MKRILIAAAVILLPVLGYSGIEAVNDSIAGSLMQALQEVPLPPQTELLDAKAIAGRIAGNGNGMQYYGAILVSSDMPEDSLRKWYKSHCPEGAWLDVDPQHSCMMTGLNADWWFDVWETPYAANYRISFCRDSIVGCEDPLWEALLNTDLRGH